MTTQSPQTMFVHGVSPLTWRAAGKAVRFFLRRKSEGIVT